MSCSDEQLLTSYHNCCKQFSEVDVTLRNAHRNSFLFLCWHSCTIVIILISHCYLQLGFILVYDFILFLLSSGVSAGL